MRKFWLIVVILAAGGLYYGLSDDDSSEPQPVAEAPVQERPTYLPPQQSWRPMDDVRPAAPGNVYGTYQAPQFGNPRFRQSPEPAPRQDPQLMPAYPGETGYGSVMPMEPGFQEYQNFYPPQAPVTPQYQFRPNESAEKSRRWTGNYALPQINAPVSPMRPGSGIHEPAYPAPQWQQPAPNGGYNPMWADSYTPAR